MLHAAVASQPSRQGALHAHRCRRGPRAPGRPRGHRPRGPGRRQHAHAAPPTRTRLHPSPHPSGARARAGPLRRRGGGAGGRREPLPRRGRARPDRGRLRTRGGGGRSGWRQQSQARRWSTTTPIPTSRAAPSTTPAISRAPFAQADFVLREELRPERGAAQPMETRGRRRPLRREPRSTHNLGHHPGADQRPRRHRRQARDAGGRHYRNRAGRGRRLRRQDLPGLPRGGADPLRRPPARQAGQVDRGSPRALHRLQPRAADGAPDRGGGDQGGAHSRHQGPLPLRQRRLLPLRPHQRPVRSGHPAGPLQDPGGAHGVRGRLHQHAGREPPTGAPASRTAISSWKRP